MSGPEPSGAPAPPLPERVEGRLDAPAPPLPERVEGRLAASAAPLPEPVEGRPAARASVPDPAYDPEQEEH